MAARRRRSPENVTWEPALAMWPEAGVYQLLLRVERKLRVTVGRLGTCELPAGLYTYTCTSRITRREAGPVRGGSAVGA